MLQGGTVLKNTGIATVNKKKLNTFKEQIKKLLAL